MQFNSPKSMVGIHVSISVVYLSSKHLGVRLGFYATVGCHPTRSSDFDAHRDGPEAYLKSLDDLLSHNLIGRGRVVALGELGLGILDVPLRLSSTQHPTF
jgi:Tat protein secretion system quality control protein TatD with DNase activity